MKTNEIKYTQIVNHLVDVFKDDALSAEYMSDIFPSYILLGGWAPNVVNAPFNRAAFMETFGEDITVKAEQEARAIIQARENTFKSTKYYAHTLEADNHEQEGQPAPVVGSFVHAIATGLKCEGGLSDAIRNLYWYDKNKEETRKELVKVCAVYNVTADDFISPYFPSELVKNNMPFAGGCCSDDYEEIDFNNSVQKATIYTEVAAVVDPAGRWYLIDSQGYDYSRYILLPLMARELFADLYQAIKDEKKREQDEERKQAEEQKAIAMAEYESRVNKWAPLMRDLRPLYEALSNIDCAKNPEEGGKAKRKFEAGRKANIKSMVLAAFPGLKISIRRLRGNVYFVTWEDGPTVEEMKKNTDFDLFARNSRIFLESDNEIIKADFSTFTEIYMFNNCYIDLCRNISDDKMQEMRTRLDSLYPGVNWFDWRWDSREQKECVLNSILDAGIMPENEYKSCIQESGGPSELVRLMATEQSYYIMPKDSKKAPVSDETGNALATVSETRKDATNEAETAPHESLTLVEVNGGVYVAGSARATFFNRKEIKAHGAQWNKSAGRWEASEPDAVATLHAWFALQKAI